MANTNRYTFHCRKARVVDGDTGRVVEEFDYPGHHAGVELEIGKPWRGDRNMCVVQVNAERQIEQRWAGVYSNVACFVPLEPNVTITVLFTDKPRKWVYNEQLKGWVPE